MDKIRIRRLRLFAFHGVNPEEKQKGQPFQLDLTLEADLTKACRSDALCDTVNYAQVIKTASAAFRRGPYNLIERAAQEVADSLLGSFPEVYAVTVCVKKPRAPVAADFETVEAEIRRERREE